MSRGGGIPAEALLDLRRRLDELSPRHRGRRVLVEGTAELFGVSRATVYRALAGHSRIEDWVRNLPSEGLRQMCSWERFCAFAREPERRTVAGDARIRVDGAFYDVDSDLAGESVTLWWGLFDQELFVEFKDRRFGPYRPSGGPRACRAPCLPGTRAPAREPDRSTPRPGPG